MSALPAGIPNADWLESLANFRALINAQLQGIELLRGQLTSLGVCGKTITGITCFPQAKADFLLISALSAAHTAG